MVQRLEAGEHKSLTDFEREIVISRLANKDALDLDALRETLDGGERTIENLELIDDNDGETDESADK